MKSIILLWNKLKQNKAIKVMSDNKIITIINAITVLYGLNMAIGNHYIRILEPPLRYVLIACLLVSPLLAQLSLATFKRRYLGWLLVLISMSWAFVAWFYFVHPVKNGGWGLALGYMLLTFVQLYRGDYRDENEH